MVLALIWPYRSVALKRDQLLRGVEGRERGWLSSITLLMTSLRTLIDDDLARVERELGLRACWGGGAPGVLWLEAVRVLSCVARAVGRG